MSARVFWLRTPPPYCDGDVQRLDDAFHDREVRQLAGARRVEVDDVQRLGALVLPVARQLHRVVAEHGDVVEVTATQAHRLAGLDVDGGEHDHEVPASRWTLATNPASRASPTLELFSGWNCTAQTLSRATAATTCRAIVRRRGDDGRVRGDRGVGVHEVDGGRGRQPAGHARAGRPPVQVVPADVRHLEAGLQALHRAAAARRGPASGRPRRCSRRAAGGRGRRRGTACRPRSARARRPRGRSARAARPRRGRRRRREARRRPRRRTSAALCVTRTSAPLRASALATLARLPMP